VCGACGFVFNAAFDPGQVSYGADYDNTQECSPYFSEYLDSLARHLLVERGLTRHRIVEIGCGKGSFLRRLVEPCSSANVGWGFDPAYQGPSVSIDGRLRFEKRLYGPDCADISADAIVCRHVIEHVPNPRELLRTVRRALTGSPRARVYFETPCIEWILRNQVIWDFFYEHCSLFSAASLRSLFEASGFAVESVQHVFDGQYLWLEGRVAETGIAPTLRPGVVPELALHFAAVERELLRDRAALISRLSTKGRVAIWGAGAKGVTLANLVDPDGCAVDCLIDLNPRKQGTFVPCTGHPVVGYEEIPRRGIRAAILMNPIYRRENERLLAAGMIPAELVD